MGFKLDNIRMKLEVSDIDRDGIIGEVESVRQKNAGFVQIKDETELGQVLDHSNKDSEDTRDALSNINSFQHAGLVALSFISGRVISKHSGDLVKEIMRKAVSIDAMGRKQSVDMVVGNKQNEIKKTQNMLGVKQE